MDQNESLAWLRDSATEETRAQTATKRGDPTAPLPMESTLYRLKRMLKPIAFPYDFRTYLRRFNVPMRGASLDIGTYDGRFLAFMEALGFEAYGLEPDGWVAHHAHEKGAKVYTGVFPKEIPPLFESMQFDFISMLGVICFFVDLRQSLAKTRAMLAPGGCVLIKCHQGGSRYYAVTGNSFFKRFGDSVQAIPTLKSMLYWLECAGFDVIDVTGGVWPSAPPENTGFGTWRKSFNTIRNKLGCGLN